MAAEFDENELLERVDGDVGFLAETVEMLAEDGRSLMGEVTSAAASGDAVALRRSAHALKGMVSNFCAPRAHEGALDLERMGKSGDLAGASEAAERLRVLLEALTDELGAFVRARS